MNLYSHYTTSKTIFYFKKIGCAAVEKSLDTTAVDKPIKPHCYDLIVWGSLEHLNWITNRKWNI